jgi:dihydrofolate synthase/folylpolyglutamate synthase
MNEYQKITEYLFRLHRVGIKLGLDNIRTLLEAVNSPQERWPAIHLAGTNGKGSTAAMLESILIEAGYKVGLYTSPHLIDFTERIRINRQVIPKEDVVAFTERLIPWIEKIQPSFFEVTTALAFWYFAQQKVDIAVVETGMGGRLDSTNVVHSLVTVITPVNFDHQNYLGNTIEEIAAEKGGIIKKGIPCITNNRHPAVLKVLSQICAEKKARLVHVFDDSSYRVLSSDLNGTRFSLSLNSQTWENLYTNMPGEYQLENVMLALRTIQQLKHTIMVPPKAVIEGLASVKLKGRLHLVSSNPNIIIDVSHNPAGVEKTLTFIRRFFDKDKINMITFLQEDKDFQKIGDLLINNGHKIFVVDLKAGKWLDPYKFLNLLLEKGGDAQILNSFAEAKNKIFQSNIPDELWLIIGSHYLAGAAYQQLFQAASLLRQD